MIQQVFTVKGKGSFPIDMLRFDQCWPRSPHDVTAMLNDHEERSVNLRGLAGPTSGRWASFGWYVTHQKAEKV